MDDKVPAVDADTHFDFQARATSLSGGTAASWADHSLMKTRADVAQSPGATLDVSDQRELRGFGEGLGFSTPGAAAGWCRVVRNAIDARLHSRAGRWPTPTSSPPGA